MEYCLVIMLWAFTGSLYLYPHSQAMEEEIDDYELLELFTCRVKKMLPPSSDII